VVSKHTEIILRCFLISISYLCSCIQVLGLIELIISHYGKVVKHFLVALHSCSQLVEYILAEMGTDSISRQIDLKQNGNIDECIQVTKKKIFYEEIVGSNAAKQSLLENVILPLTLDSRVLLQLFGGVRATSGNVLLYGPPGTGKTCLVEATANECKASLFSIRPSDMLSKYQGESERYLSAIFEKARTVPRSIIFFDGNKALCLTTALIYIYFLNIRDDDRIRLHCHRQRWNG